MKTSTKREPAETGKKKSKKHNRNEIGSQNPCIKKPAICGTVSFKLRRNTGWYP